MAEGQNGENFSFLPMPCHSQSLLFCHGGFVKAQAGGKRFGSSMLLACNHQVLLSRSNLCSFCARPLS